jgi:penicillin-binding protein 1A
VEPAPRRKAGRKGRRGSGERPRRSFLNRLLRRSFYWSCRALPLGRIAGAGLVGYYAAQLPGASEWKVPDRPPNVQIVATDGTLIGNRGDTGGESVRIEHLPDTCRMR